jgi:hypothetical protein
LSLASAMAVMLKHYKEKDASSDIDMDTITSMSSE